MRMQNSCVRTQPVRQRSWHPRACAPDVAIVDPPRKGCAPEVFAAIDKMGIERLVYVSCDPATLARDLALLATMGYTARRACGVDLFPRTPMWRR